MIKNPPANAGDSRDGGSIPGFGKSRKWQPTPMFLPEKAHGGCSSWSHKELVTTEHTCI